MSEIRFRFATEEDELDAQIAKGQQGFWATHVEVLLGANLALRFDDFTDRWAWTSERIAWKREVLGVLGVKATHRNHFYGFLHQHVVGKRYDMRCLAGVQYLVSSHDYQKWNCSDFIYLGLVAIGVVRGIPGDLWHITPRDLMILIGAVGEVRYI